VGISLRNTALVAIGDLLRLKIWSKIEYFYRVQQFVLGIAYKILNDFLARDYFFTEAWYIPYLTIRKDEAFIDVGANVGFYTTRMARRAGQVFAFEPNPEAYRKLKTRTQTLSNVTCFPYALGSEEKQVKLYPSDDIRATGSSTKKESLQYVSVQCFALDDLFKKKVINADKIGLIKIDVEGAEHEVLLGAKGSLTSFHPRILLEIHGKDSFTKCMRLLKELRYRVHKVKQYKSWNLWWLIAEV